MIKRSPLYNIQKDIGAKFTKFADFEMPIHYSSIKDEHMTVRKSVGLFDVSHMNNTWIKGEGAEKLITLTTLEDASCIPDKKGQYTAILREDGKIIDDTIFLHLGDKYMMMPNAGMGNVVTDWLNLKAEENNICASAENVSDDFAILAVQGPKSRDTLQKLTNTDLKTVGFFGCQYIDIAGINCIISHTGYTGELGFELNINVENVEKIWQGIMKAGEEFDIKPIGLGARDTLRLEKCFLLAGNEFEGGRTPLEATMGWAINWDHDFIGKNALLKQKEKGDYQRLTCLVCEEKGIPRHGCEIQKAGKKVGIVTSGTLSPCLNKGIAMGYVHPEYREKDSNLDIIIRDKTIKTKVVKPPFVPKDWLEKNKQNI
jgi:aminomethyltransferase